MANALRIMTETNEVDGKVVELYGPKEYSYRSLIELFQDVSLRQKRVLDLPKPVARSAVINVA